ncbi:hypothetical protein [Cellvibrio sp.]
MEDEKAKKSKNIMGFLFCLEGAVTVLMVVGFAIYKYLHQG